MELQLIIPSRSRWMNQKTLINLTPSLWPITTVVIPEGQYYEYRTRTPEKVSVITFNGQGIHDKRQYILHLAKTGKVIMLDDDLSFYKRNTDGRFTVANGDPTEDMVATLVNMLDKYPMVGLVEKFMSQTQPRGVKEYTRISHVLGINRDLLPKPWPEFRLRVGEEYDFHLQLLTRGFTTAVTTEWSKLDKFNAKGGCNDWRTVEIIRQETKKMRDYFPDLVTYWERDNGVGIQYNWRKAKGYANELDRRDH